MATWEEMSRLIDQFGDERNVAARIKALRKERNDAAGREWSQEELARRMTDAGFPMTHTSIWKIENPDKKSGGRAIPISEAIGFARVFGVTLAELLLPNGQVEQIEASSAITRAMDAFDIASAAWASYVDAVGAARQLHRTAHDPEALTQMMRQRRSTLADRALRNQLNYWRGSIASRLERGEPVDQTLLLMDDESAASCPDFRRFTGAASLPPSTHAALDDILAETIVSKDALLPGRPRSINPAEEGD